MKPILSRTFICASDTCADYVHQVPAPYLRRNFELEEIPQQALLSVCGLGFYEVWVNGVRITKGLLSPYISNPDQVLDYDVYAIAPYLKTGKNTLAFQLGNGMQNAWGGYIWDFEKAAFRSAPKLAVWCGLQFADGSEMQFEADTRFVTAPSPLLADDLRGGEVYDAIMSTVTTSFNLNPLLLLPPIVVVVLIVMKKPTLPTFTAGIVVGAILAVVFQGTPLLSTDGAQTVFAAMYEGFKGDTGNEVVNSMLQRGGLTSMLNTIGLLISAGVFGAPLRTAGVVDILLDFVRKVARNSKVMSTGVLVLHAVFFTITGAYYVSYPVVGSMVKDMFPEYGLDKKNLMRIMLDTGTGLAPLVPWATTGAYTASTLGVSNMSFAAFAPMLWLSIVISVVMGVTGIGMAKLKDAWAKKA